MDFWVGVATGFIVGSILSVILLGMVIVGGKLNKEHEAYSDGYIAGLNENKEKEVA
jgi:hypothetical protein